MTSDVKAMERVYYVVTDDSDRDDDVINSCDSRTDDVVKKCSPHQSDTVPFRLLRAYRTDRRRCRHQNDAVPPQSTALLTSSTALPVANSHDVGPETREKAEAEETVWTPVVASRKEVCVSFFKRFVAFLLSTVGLSILAIIYSILGGLLFAAVEAPHEETVKHSVKESIDWHVGELWRLTSELNVLHPVSKFHRDLLTPRQTAAHVAIPHRATKSHVLLRTLQLQ